MSNKKISDLPKSIKFAGGTWDVKYNGNDLYVKDIRIDTTYDESIFSIEGFFHPNCKSTINYDYEGENEMSTLQRLAALSLDDDTRLLRKYDIIDEENYVTQEGAKVLVQVVLEEYKEKVIEKLKKLDEEDKPKELSA